MVEIMKKEVGFTEVSKKRRPKILLADYKNAEVSAQLPQLFKQAGCEVEVFCGSDSWLLKNKYWDTWHNTEKKVSVAYVKALENLVSNGHYDWVVLTDDLVIRTMNESVIDPVLFRKIFPITKIEHRDLLGFKSGLSRLCQKYNIVTPAFVIYDGITDPLKLMSNLKFPILLKIDESGGGKGIFEAADAQMALNIFKALPDNKKIGLVFQEYILGDNISVEALFKNGRLLGYSSSKVLENIKGEFSVSRVREYFKLPNLEIDLSRVADAFGLNGFASITFIRSHETGQFFLIEADLRPHGWFYLAKFGGVDFSELIARYLDPDSEKKYSQILTNQNTKVIRYFSRDLKWAIQNWNFFGIVRWCVNKDGCWRFVPWHDQKLFWASLIGVAKHCLYYIKPFQPLMRAAKRGYRYLAHV